MTSHHPTFQLRLADILQTSERVRGVLGNMPLDAFEADWQMLWLVERGVLIISEASRHLPDELELRHPNIPWRKIAASATYCAMLTSKSRRR